MILQIAFTRKKDFGTEEQKLKWAHAQRTLHGLQPPETKKTFGDRSNFTELNQMAEEAKRRAEIARYIKDTPHSKSCLNQQILQVEIFSCIFTKLWRSLPA